MRFSAPVIAIVAVAAWILFSFTHAWIAAVEGHDLSVRGRVVPPESENKRLPVFLENDSCLWMLYAETLLEKGLWRLRENPWDNAPSGREMHWAQLYAWLILIAGGLRSAWVGEPLPDALAPASSWINPALCLILIAIGAMLWVRRSGWLPACAFAVAVLFSGDVAWGFQPLRPDHQSLHILFAGGAFLAFLLSGFGWVERTGGDPNSAGAKGLLAFSGALGGFGLWVGATPQIAVIASIMVGLAILIGCLPRNADDGTFRPELWRWWSVTGALLSLVFYVIEYAPASFSMRLEVNHPLYAAFWLGACEILIALARLRVRRAALGVSFAAKLLIPLVMAAALPLCIAAGNPDWYFPKDPFVSRMHNYIGEFYSYARLTDGNVLFRAFSANGLLVFVPFCALAWLVLARLSLRQTATLGMAFLLAVALSLAAFVQVRWLGFAAVFVAILLCVILEQLRARWPGRTVPVIAAAVLAVQAFLGFSNQRNDIRTIARADSLASEVIRPIEFKRIALALRSAAPPGGWTVLAEPDIAPALMYYGRIRTVASLYWENREGIRGACEVFAAHDATTAAEEARRRGLDLALVSDSPHIPRVFHHIATGMFDTAAADATLLGRLLAGTAYDADWISEDPALSLEVLPIMQLQGVPIPSSFRVFRIAR